MAKWSAKEVANNVRNAIAYRASGLCVYCGRPTIYGDTKRHPSVDHVVPRSYGGKHGADNLLHCCISCNGSRGNRDVKQFAIYIAAKYNRDPMDIMTAIVEQLATAIDIEAADARIAEQKRIEAER